MDFRFPATGGYAVASLPVALIMPERFRFSIRLRGSGSIETLEFKLTDKGGANVWWDRRSQMSFSAVSDTWQIDSSGIVFAWGPAGGGLPSQVAALELGWVTSRADAGSVWLEALSCEDLSARERTLITASSVTAGCTLPPTAAGWRGTGSQEWIGLELDPPRPVAGLIIHWEAGMEATLLEVDVSDDGLDWVSLYPARVAGGRCSRLFFGKVSTRHLRLRLRQAGLAGTYGIERIETLPVERARSLTEFLFDAACDEPRGRFPETFSRQQTYWTVVGALDCPHQALFTTDGRVEVQRAGFTLESFLVSDGELLSWAGAHHQPALPPQGLPLPWVTRQHPPWSQEISAVAIAPAGHWGVLMTCRVCNDSDFTRSVLLAIAARPFQVTPPWQAHRELGEVHTITQIHWRNGLLEVDDAALIVPFGVPDGTAASTWLQPWWAANLASGGALASPAGMPPGMPGQAVLQDPDGLAEAAFCWRRELAPGEAVEHAVFVPFETVPEADRSSLLAALRGRSLRQWSEAAAESWREPLSAIAMDLPTPAGNIADVYRTALAHILINRDGPALQPGPRRYARSWIRDGATMCAALLRAGFFTEVRDFLLWYAPWQREDGYVPCCVDRLGVDDLVEHDSHGQWLYCVVEYYRFSGDLALVEQLQTTLWRAADYLLALRLPATEHGLLPPSVSHEGYMAQPVHSYWDDCWALRGLRDLAWLCGVLNEGGRALIYAAEAASLHQSIGDSVRQVMADRELDYVPGSVEWADFDPTATACAAGQLGLADCFPEAALQHTFAAFLLDWRKRVRGERIADKITAYEIRNINALVALGRREDACELLNYYVADCRPVEWHQWPEITWADPAAPGHLGDLPHSWIGAEFVLAVRSMFLEEDGDTLHLGRGLPSAWLDGKGVRISHWPTAFGRMGYAVSRNADGAIELVLEGQTCPPSGILIDLPLPYLPMQIRTDPANVLRCEGRQLLLRQSPAVLTLTPLAPDAATDHLTLTLD